MTGLRAPAGAGRRGGPAADRAAPARAAGGGRQAPAPGTPFGIGSWLRWAWRQLTSMRTALILLFLLAAGSVPGSMFPQEGVSPGSVQQYYAAHPALAPVLNALGLFNVFAAPWFAAICLLLFTSLAGCVLPRTLRLARSARALPPRAPRNLARLPCSVTHQTTLPPEEALAAAAGLLRRKRFRLRTGDGWVSAEKGYRREAGNLLFHVALLALLGAIALGGMFGYKADKLLVEGDSFANVPTSLDEFHPGRLVSAADLPPFTITLGKFRASYIGSGPLAGQPSAFSAYIRYASKAGEPARGYDLRVNHPLVVDGVRVFLIGHGYAPVFRVTDGTGRVAFDQAVPFIAAETRGFTSQGVVKVPDARPEQLGFAGVFLPTAVDVAGRLGSAFPAPLLPRVSLVSYAGNLEMNAGVPQSVYALDTHQMRRLPIAPRPLAPGQSMRLPGGAGMLTFAGYRQWVSLAITYDPGQLPALLAGIAALAGLLLSFLVRRRRVFARARAVAGGQTVVEFGGLARSDAGGGFDAEFAGLAEELRSAHAASAPPGSGDDPAATHPDLSSLTHEEGE